MISALIGAFAGDRYYAPFVLVLAAVTAMGVAGEQAAARMSAVDGSGSFRVYQMDALFGLTLEALEERAKVLQV